MKFVRMALLVLLLSAGCVLLASPSLVDGGHAADYDYRACAVGFPAVFGPYEIYENGRVERNGQTIRTD